MRSPPGALARQRRLQAWLMLVPMLATLFAVVGWPLGRTFWFSLTDAELWDRSRARFVGLENYVGEFGVLTDPDWWNAVANTLVFTLASVALETLLGLGVALMLHHPSRIRALLRATLLLPWAIPTVVSARMWNWMLHDQFGIVNHWLLALGLIAEPVAWTADPHYALASVVLVDVWKTTPFMALLILAALQMVPSDVYDAARVDGVPPFTVFRRVTLPLIFPGIAVAMIFRMLDAMRVFDLIYVMTSNSRDMQSMSTYVRQQLIEFQLVGYGSAAAIALAAVVAVVAAVFLAVARSRMAAP